MKKLLLLCLAFALLALAGGCSGERADEAHGAQLVYATKDYEEINVLVDEYAEIGQLLFDGLMRRDENDAIVPALAASVEYDPETYTYVFHLREGVHWHDGKPLRSADVKFTIEAVKNPLVDSLHAPNFEEVREITEVDDRTVRIRLSAPNAAFLDYMMQPILPAHLLAGQDLTTTGFFRSPVGTGPFRMESWTAGKEIVLVKNEDYYRGAPRIDRFVVKIVADDAAEAKALADGAADLARLSPRAAAPFEGRDGYRCYAMKTANYGSILINCAHPYWQRNRDLLPAIAYAVDRTAVINEALLGHGIPAYSPLQRSLFNNPNVEHCEGVGDSRGGGLQEGGRRLLHTRRRGSRIRSHREERQVQPHRYRQRSGSADARGRNSLHRGDPRKGRLGRADGIPQRRGERDRPGCTYL